MEEKPYLTEDEIDLRDYINVIVKRRKLILTVFFVSIIAAAMVSFIMPNIYEISMLVQPPNLGVTDAGVVRFLDSPANMKAKVDSGAFDSKIVQSLKIDPKKIIVKFGVTQPKDSTFLKITIPKKEMNKELGMNMLKQLFVELKNFYNDVIESKKNELEKQISLVSNSIATKNDEIKLSAEKLTILNAREDALINELKDTKTNIEKLLSKRDALLDRKLPTDDMSSLLYSNTIQQNMNYSNQLNNQLVDIKVSKQSIGNDVKALQNKISDLKIQIERLAIRKDNIENVNLIQEPQSSVYPISPSRIKVVATAGIASLMFGVFLAFFMKYWGKSSG